MPELPRGLLPLAELVRERQTVSREQFLLAHPTPVLIVPVVDAFADGDSFSTRPTPVDRGPPTAWAVVKVKKRAGDAFPNFIWVGREAKCDLALPFEGLSKLHAQFILRPDGEVDLLDTGSANGTYVNGQRLQDNAPLRMRDGARVQMGALDMTYRTAAGFWEALQSWSGGGAR